jgi:hypothetical protein
MELADGASRRNLTTCFNLLKSSSLSGRSHLITSAPSSHASRTKGRVTSTLLSIINLSCFAGSAHLKAKGFECAKGSKGGREKRWQHQKHVESTGTETLRRDVAVLGSRLKVWLKGLQVLPLTSTSSTMPYFVHSDLGRDR